MLKTPTLYDWRSKTRGPKKAREASLCLPSHPSFRLYSALSSLDLCMEWDKSLDMRSPLDRDHIVNLASALPSVQALMLSSIDADALPSLSLFTALRRLRISCYDIWSNLALFSNLEELHLDSCGPVPDSAW